MMTWLTLVLAETLKSYMSYKNPVDAMSKWKSYAFLMLELLDQVKDLIYLYGKPHNLWMSLAFI